MTSLPRISTAEAVLPGVLKIRWNDGYEGIVDLRGIIGKGPVFEPLRDAKHFSELQVEQYGHSIFWGEDGNEEVDFGCDRLREMAEEQAAFIAKAS